MFAWLKDRFWTRIYQAASQWQKDDAGLMAAAVSYYAALSFFPLLLVLISGLGFFLRFSGWAADAQDRILVYVAENSSRQLANEVSRLLGDIKHQAVVGGPLGLITLLVASLALFANFQSAFDRIWRVPATPNRGYLAAIIDVLFYRLRAFLILLAIALLILMTFIAGLALNAVYAAVPQMQDASWIWRGAQLLITISLNFTLATALYRTLPKVRVRWLEAAEGGILAAIVWEIGRQLLAAWVIGSRYGAYGVVGAFIAMLLWIYYAVAVFFLGAEYAQVAYTRRAERESRP